MTAKPSDCGRAPPLCRIGQRAMSSPDQPFGWRKRIGLLSPTVIETRPTTSTGSPPTASRCAPPPPTSSIGTRRISGKHVIDPIVTAVKYLASRHVDYIIHTGMPVVTTRGKGFEEELVKLITDATGLPGIHQHPLRHPRARPSRRAQCRCGDALSAGAAPVGADVPGRERLQGRRRAYRGRRLQAAAGRDPGAHRRRRQACLAAAPSADGVYIPCNQWSGPMRRR